VGAGVDASEWQLLDCRDWNEWRQLLDEKSRDGISFANEHVVMKWLPYTQLPHTRETQYMRDQHVIDLLGRDTFLMTPFLRQWQYDNLAPLIPEGSRVFDIGIGTGRSRDLWAARKLQVWGVEPDIRNFTKLTSRGIPELREARNWGGERSEIKEWLGRDSVDVVVMIYSITFFSGATLDALLDNVEYVLRPGGKFIILGMDGQRVRQWLRSGDVDNECFRIHALKKNKIEITMKNPFTLVNAQTEYLTDFDALEQRLASGYTTSTSRHVEPPFYLARWPAQFVAAQKLLVFEKNPKQL
jgi:SAM-dependent methyltransferase